MILQAFLEDDPDHPGEQRGVLAGGDLEMDVGKRRHLGPSGIDHDQLTLGLATPHYDERVGLQPAELGP